MDDVGLESLRIDKWLWAARFFKTRSLATQAVSGGLVRVAEQRVKASRRLRRGEIVHVRRGAQAWDVVVRGLRDERRPAPEAQTLYEETPASIERRTSEQGRRDQAQMRRAQAQGRPTKRERRALVRWRDRQDGSLNGSRSGDQDSPHR
jgi:ribosome-associated heat shock protein Hsp15